MILPLIPGLSTMGDVGRELGSGEVDGVGRCEA